MGNGTFDEHLAAAERLRPGSARIKSERGTKKLPEIGYLWGWYLDLSLGRPYAGMGSPMPIPAAEIWAWSQLNGVPLRPWEVRCLRLLDNAHMQELSAALSTAGDTAHHD